MTQAERPQAFAIARALDAPDAEERRQATALVPALALDHAIPLLLRSLGDDDWRVRKEGTIAARAFATERALIDALLDRLAPGDNVGLRNAAVEVLASSGSAATPLVADRLEHLDADGRKLAVEILGRSRDPAALGPLERALDDEDDNVRQSAVEAIAGLGSSSREAVRVVLMRCLDDPDGFVRLTALEGLNAIGAAMPWERLAQLAEDSTLRPAALAAAALSESPRAAPMLARALASSRGGTFTQALSALAWMADGPLAADVAEALRAEGSELGAVLLAAAVPAEAAASDPHGTTGRPSMAEASLGATGISENERRAMALHLAAMARAPGAADAAIALLQEQVLAPAASRALSVLGPVALPRILAHLVGSPAPEGAPPTSSASPDVRADLLELAASMVQATVGTGAVAQVLEVLRAAVRDPSPRVATSALVHLARLGTPDDFEVCAELCRSPDPSIAHPAEGALGALATRHVASAISFADAQARRDPLSLGATVVLGALAGIRGDERPMVPTDRGGSILSTPGGDLAFLAQAAGSGDTRTRRAAVAAVAEMGGAAAAGGVSPLDVLGFALADEERSVQLAAARALGRICARPVSVGTPHTPGSRNDDAGTSASTPPPSFSSGRASAPRASDVLELVARSQDEDLLAATVRALGDAAALSLRSPRTPADAAVAPGSQPAATTTDELILALAPLAHGAPSAVAIAAVEALGRAHEDTPGRLEALVGALNHPDAAVVRAAMLKLETSPRVHAPLARCLDHPVPEVRLLAAEMLGEIPFPAAREHLARRAAVEQDKSVRRALEAAQGRAGELASGHVPTPSRMPPRGS